MGLARPRMTDLTFGPQGASAPPGTKCAHYLFQGEFACCWIYKRVNRNYYSMYRYACHSNPKTEDCNAAQHPGDTMTATFNDPHTCRREVIVTRIFVIGMSVVNAPSGADFKAGITEGLVSLIGITADCVERAGGPEVTVRGAEQYVRYAFKIGDCEELELHLDEAIISRNVTLIEQLNATLATARNLKEGDEDVYTELMRSENATEHFSVAFQELIGSADVVVAGAISVNVTVTEALGKVFVDSASSCSVQVLVLIISAFVFLSQGV